ncbi:MAG: DNA primase [Sphingomicrobium sp.]
MTLSPQWLDELRSRTILSSVIAPSVKLVRAGREWKACCPFHQEKTPSFTINDDKHFYHCFGCGAHGDAIRFLTDHRGLPFMDAVKELASKAGMEVPAPDPRAKERSERTASLTDVMGEVQTWFADQLQGAEGSSARDYLAKRGIDPALTKAFGIGLAPESRAKLKQGLAHLGEDKLIETGMLIQPDPSTGSGQGAGASYDRFRGRLMIPIRDARGRVIAFGGRILGQGEPKYLNSPDTPLFDKGHTLYNLDRAGPASRKSNRLIVVEGYMDVIGLARAGIDEVVAPNGTAVTEAQLERMWRLDPAPILCFDGDNAGKKAAIRAALRALPHLAPDRTLRFAELPAGMDPDDLVTSGGRPAVEALLAEPIALNERLWRHEVAAQPLATPEARAGLKARLVDHARSIGHGDLARLYRDQWLERFDREIAPQRASLRRSGERGKFIPWGKRQTPGEERFLQSATATEASRSVGKSGIDAPTARALILGFANFPEALPAHCEALAALHIPDRKTAHLRDELVNAAFAGAALDRTAVATILGSDGVDRPMARSALGFSFTRRDSDPVRARSDLAAAVEIIADAEEVEKALSGATERLMRDTSEEAFDEQRRLIAAQQGLRERLASLAGTD